MVTIRQNLNSLELKSLFRDKAFGCYDEVVHWNQLFMDSNSSKVKSANLCLITNDTRKAKTIHPDNSALSQLLVRHKIPTRFFSRCPSWLQARIFNEFNRRTNPEYLIRYSNKKDEVRAFLSSRYGIIDDIPLYNIVFDLLDNRDDIQYSMLEYDNHFTQLYAYFNNARGVHEEREYRAGLCITNSETGHSSVWIEPVVSLLGSHFFNRRTLKAQGVDCRIIHRGDLQKDRIISAVEASKIAAQVGVVQLAEQFNSPTNKDRALRFIENTQAFPSRFVQILEEEWQDKENLVKAEAALQILSLAKELPLFQRININQEVGKYLGLFSNYRTRFGEIAKEISNESTRN